MKDSNGRPAKTLAAKQSWLAASHLLLLVVLMTGLRAGQGPSDTTRISQAGTLSTTAVTAAALKIACGTNDTQTAGS